MRPLPLPQPLLSQLSDRGSQGALDDERVSLAYPYAWLVTVRNLGCRGSNSRRSMGPEQPPSVDQRLQRMTQSLALTGDQQEKIKPILEGENSQMQELRSNSSLSQEDRMAKMKQIHEGTASQINSILTPDQQKKFAEMSSRMGRGRGGPNSSTPANPQPPQQ